MSLLSLQNVSKAYGEVKALRDVSLTLEPNSRTAVVGASGSGKSTLLRLIAGFDVPDSGRVAMDGQILANGAAAVPAYQRGIGFVSQDGALFPHLSVADNIGFGLDRSGPEREARILELMDMVELARSMQNRRPHELSGGQQQRVALARALARRPRLMLLDEPFSALDAGLREKLRRTVAGVLRESGIAVLLVTHDQAEALSFADQLAVLRGGRLVQAGPPRELYLRPADRDIATFLGDAVLLPAELEAGAAKCRLGRIAAMTNGRRRVAEVMLRPEQLQLTAASPGEREPGAIYGTIIEAEFGGSIWSLAVALETECAATVSVPPLLVRSASFAMPHRGQRVRITVTGEAHVLGQGA
jgi:iron(III) transport system ATP-binding protein